MFDGVELDEAREHDDGARLSIVAGPTAEACKDPGGEGKRALWMRVLLARGLALEAGRDGLESGLVVEIEGIFERALGGALALMHELQHGDSSDETGRWRQLPANLSVA